MKYCSPTEISEFLTCPRKHFFKRVMEIKHNPSEQMLFGTICHEFFELYHKGIPIDELMEELKVKSYTLSEKEAKLLIKIMENYIKFEEYLLTDKSLESSIIPRPGQVEFMFEDSIEDDTFSYLGIIMRGKPDLLFKQGNIITIGEHKTSAEAWPVWKFNINIQAKIYHMIVSRLFPGYDVRVLFNIAIKTPGTRTDDITRLFQRYEVKNINVKDTTVMVTDILEDMIKSSQKPLPYASGCNCDWCAYTSLCSQGDNILSVMSYHNRYKWLDDLNIFGGVENE